MIAMLLAACVPLATCGSPPVSPCASPTPTAAFDQVADADLAGYSLFYRSAGGVFQKLADLPCVWWDTDGDGIGDTRVCRGAELPIPLQRYCPTCAPYNEYEFAVKAYDTAGNGSLNFSNVLTVCFSPLCVNPGPCD